MGFTYHPTDGPYDTLLIRWQRRHVGFINRPPRLHRWGRHSGRRSPLADQRGVGVPSMVRARPAALVVW